MTTVKCRHCGAPLREAVGYHERACEKIEMGLLAEQLTPTVDRKPKGWMWESYYGKVPTPKDGDPVG